MKRVPGVALLLCTIPFGLAAAETPPLLWADFKEPLQSHLGAPVQSIAVSERSGDAVAGSSRVVDASVQVEGRLSHANGSQWATLGIEVGGEARGLPVDLSPYETLRIRLASSTPRVLRIRLKGLDPKIQNAGCYPVMMQRVGTQPTDYVIPLSAFGPETFCGERGASVQQTLPAVARVEVTANEPSSEPVRFQVGRMEFFGGLAGKATPEAPATTAASASSASAAARNAARKAAPPEPPRRRTTAEAPTGQPVRQVTCERNARYGLMMCF
jgi:hypothetical protein